MEEWRALAETVQGNLEAIAVEASGAGGVLASVDTTHSVLRAVVGTLRTIPPGPGDGHLGGAFASACAALEGAHGEVARLVAICNGDGYAFELYAFRAVQYDAMPYRIWRVHIRDVAAGARDAARRLLDAASEARAAESLLRESRSFPNGSLLWRAWRDAARRLAIQAADNAELALDALRRMRDAVVLESFDTRMMLNG